MKKYIYLLSLVIFIKAAYCQTDTNKFNNSSVGLFDQDGYFTAGLLSMKLKYPTKLKILDYTQKGFMIGYKSNSKNIDEIDIANYLVLSINIGSENSFGISVDDNILKYDSSGIISYDTVKHYTGFINLISYNLNTEIIHSIPVINRKIIGGFGITFFNIGGNFTYMSGGRYDKRVIGAIDILPFYMQLYGKLCLKNATIGVGVLYNPYSFVEYRFGPKAFMGDYGELKLSSSMYNKFMLQFYINFN
jgi:hypothetical protein